MAQGIHRVDMRLRLGLLQDTVAIERQIARDAKEAATKKAKAEIPTVKTEAQTLAEERTAAKEKEKGVDKEKQHHPPRIRPLTEAKAIETGANFISETFIFTVALGLLLVERWYSYSKESNRRSDILEKLEELERRDAAHASTIETLEKEIKEFKTGAKNRWFWSRGQDPSKAESLQGEPVETAKRTSDNHKPGHEGKNLDSMSHVSEPVSTGT